jgi:hypothetical protein
MTTLGLERSGTLQPARRLVLLVAARHSCRGGLLELEGAVGRQAARPPRTPRSKVRGGGLDRALLSIRSSRAGTIGAVLLRAEA